MPIPAYPFILLMLINDIVENQAGIDDFFVILLPQL